jgi:aspartate-semialdehyde dehydrogenase
MGVEPGPPWGWDEDHRKLRVAVVGATGAVGRELLGLLVEARHPREGIACYARTEQQLSLSKSGRFEVMSAEGMSTERLDHPDLAFLCTPAEVSRDLAPRLAEDGVRVIDLSSAYRMRPEIPLVIPEINGQCLDHGPRIVANPNCTTAVAALPLAVLDRAAHLEEVIVVSYQAASGAGIRGLARLEAEMRASAGLDPEALSADSPFPATLALNVIPAVADVDLEGWSGEERKIDEELRKILSRPDLVVEATTARVPVERCHSVAVHARFARALAPAEARRLLSRAPGVLLSEDPHGPRPRECSGTDPVHVGRVRAGARGARSLCFFAVGDQLRKGAALNAFQVAARLPATLQVP